MGIVNGIPANNDNYTEITDNLNFNTLFFELFDRLVFFALQLVKDKSIAEDIVQDAFVNYWDQRNTVACHKTAIKNYLYSTVRNASLNHLRHYKVVESFEKNHGGAEPEHPPVVDAIITAEVIAQIHSALQSLPASYQEVSTLSYLEGKKNHEIAADLDMSVNTVKKQKQRALQLLRMRLSPELLLVVLSAVILAAR